MEEEIQSFVNSSPDIHEINLNEKKLYIVGTAHVSKESVSLVSKSINLIKPDNVFIELDENRYKAIFNPNKWETLNIFQIIKEKKTMFLFAQLILAGFQKKIGKHLGVKPGSEMIEAIKTSKELNLQTHLVDREISTTLKRLWRKTPLFKKMILLSNLIASFFSKQELTEEELNKLKTSDVMTELMNELSKILPESKKVLVDERDEYLAKKTLAQDFKTGLLVIGAGHVSGVKEYLKNENQDLNVDALNEIPPSSIYMKILPWLIPAAIFGVVIYGFFMKDYESLKKGAIIWVLFNGIFATIGTILTLGHPLNYIIAFVSAPITSLNPTIGCGFVVGIAEFCLRKPRVKDFQDLGDDITNIKGWYRNRITRILLVFFGSSMGSAVGTWLALSYFIAS